MADMPKSTPIGVDSLSRFADAARSEHKRSSSEKGYQADHVNLNANIEAK